MPPRSASRGRRRSRSEFGTWLAGGLVFAVTILAVAAFLWLRLTAEGRPVLNPRTLCPVEGGEQSTTVVLLDASDQWPDVTREEVRKRLEKTAEQVPSYGLLELRLLDPNVPDGRITFSKCNPGNGSDQSPITANPQLARKRWLEQFITPLHQALDQTLTQSEAATSPILATLQRIAVEKFDENRPGTLILISDMIEHTPEYSQYRGDLSYDHYKQSVAYRKQHTDLKGARVSILYVQRLSMDSAKHAQFWLDWIADSNGKLGEAVKLQGSELMQETTPLPSRSVKDLWRGTAPPTAVVLFSAFVLMGVAFIVPAKLYLVPNYIVALVPVFIMLGYAAVAVLAPSIHLRDDQTGDNLYYMGFIFTLTSLAVALYQFDPDGGFDQVVRNFGVAISSTITGIALRVLFNQMRQDPIEVEHAARQELAEASRRVRHQLDETVLAFNHFRTATIQSLQEVHEELLKRLLSEGGSVAERAVKPIEQAAQKTGAALDDFATAMTETLGRTVAQLGDESAKVSKSIGDIEATLAALNAKLASMQTPDRIVEIKLEPVVASLTAAVAEFGRQGQSHSAALQQAVEALAHAKPAKKRSHWRFWGRS